ncbi:uncharacterized protein LOC133292338 [Gastrolobium bilobum]|uniref:uncharacterized protein LOC133292338 n=1 Tax=Gastrolobium bilobum TaxID=150636 RepID=UPI002AB2ADDF|nr:uncharacterized protein LOC133292338 [Gastrolobium bilobum]
MTPTRASQTASIVRPNIEANNLELKPALVQLIQKEQFVGGSTENPYCHLDDFLLYCDTLKVNRVPIDAILVRLLPCSLKDEARDWLQSQPKGSITSWDDLAVKFLARFFSASKMARLKAEITAFEQKESESLYEAWTRFKGLLRKCPQHGIEAWEKARIFFQGMTSNTRTLVNAASGGSLKTKTPEEALELLESLASQEFDNAPTPVAPKRSGIMKLEGYDALFAQNEQMLQMRLMQLRIVNTSETHKNHQRRSMHSGMIKRTRTIEEGINMLNPPMPLQQQPQGTTSEWEKAFAQLSKTRSDYIQNTDAFRDETRASFRNQEASIRNLETQIGQLARQFTERTHGTFSSNTDTNPKAQCNAIVTRSGIVIQPVEKPPVEKKKEAEPEVELEAEPEAEKDKEEDEVEAEKSIPERRLFKWEKKKALDRQPKAADPPPYEKVPYPQWLNQEVQKQQYNKFLDIFKKLQVNIPFAEALEIMPNYAKFMKDLISKKHKLKECETVALTEECSAIIQKKLPPRPKDLGSFSISI